MDNKDKIDTIDRCRICGEPTGTLSRLYSDGLCGKQECYDDAFGSDDPVCPHCEKIASVLITKGDQFCIDCLPEELREKNVCTVHNKLLDHEYYCWKCTKEENERRKKW